MDNIDRLASTANVPSDQDVLRSRVCTTGMMNTVFGLPSLRLSVFDCGGRSKRREWVHYFDDVQCIIFVAALSGYDETLFEDRTGVRFKSTNISLLPFLKSLLMIPIYRTKWKTHCAYSN